MGRPCDRCGSEFTRATKYNKICDKCANISFSIRDAKVHNKMILSRIFNNLNKNVVEVPQKA